MIQDTASFGSLAPLVETVGWIVSAGIAIGWSWRRRTRWEPSEEDLPSAPNKVSGLLTALAVVLLFTQYSQTMHVPLLVRLLYVSTGVTVLSLLLYGFLITNNTYQREVVRPDGSVVKNNLIGGFKLRPIAAQALKRPGKTIQQILKDGAYEADQIWTRPSRAVAKTLFVLCYLGLTVGGSIALTCAAILLLLKNAAPS
jgi:hypothetical protein